MRCFRTQQLRQHNGYWRSECYLNEEGKENLLAGKVRNSNYDTINSRGTKLLELCDTFGFRIMNGTCGSDKHGEFTIIGRQGCSVIDYWLIRGDWSSVLTDFKKVNLQFLQAKMKKKLAFVRLKN